MAIWVDSNSGTARGISLLKSDSSTDTYIWDGYSFFPTYGFQNFTTSGWVANGVSKYVSQSTWDMTDYYCGHECVLFVFTYKFDSTQNGYYYIKWYDPDGNLIYNSTRTINTIVPVGSRYQAWNWTGVGMAIDNGYSRVNEVYKDGVYQIKVTGLMTATYNFTINNINTSRLQVYSTDTIGSLWVEGDNLYMISGDAYKIKIKNDGSSYGYVNTTNSGHLWISDIITTTPYLSYVDQSGYIRHTHTGDLYGTSASWATMDIKVNVGSANAGYLWMRTNWSFLMYVTVDGYKCRIGAGYLYGNGP